MNNEQVGNISYDARIETKNIKSDAAEVERIAKKSGDDIGDHHERGSNKATEALKNFSKIAVVALTAVTGAAIAFGVSSVKAYQEAEAAQKQTEAVLQSTGYAAGVTAKQVNDLASAFEATTPYADEVIQSAENMLLTFTNISKDVFPQTTQAVLDMATAMGTDLKSTAIQVGKALQDPVLGATALQRVGVRLTESQKDLIQAFVDAGDAASAQQVILKELSTEFGGSAEAAGKTFAGQLKILQNRLGNVQEAIGKVIADGIAPYIKSGLAWFDSIGGVDGAMNILKNTFKSFVTFIMPIVNGFMSIVNQVGGYLLPKLQALWSSVSINLIPAFQRLWSSTLVPLAGFIGTVLVGAVGFLIDTLKFLSDGITFLMPVVGGAAAGFMAYSITVNSVSTAIKLAAAAQAAFNLVMNLNPVILVTSLVAGLVVGLGILIGTTDRGTNATEALNRANDNLRVSTDNVKTAESNLVNARLAREGSDIAVARAQERLTQLVDSGSASALDLREANYNLGVATDAAARAATGETEALQKLSDQKVEQEKAAAAVVEAEKAKQAAIDATTESIKRQKQFVDNLQGSLNLLNNKNYGYTVDNKIPAAKPFLNPYGTQGRASGGSVSANTPYFVGENKDGSLNKTSELFMPRSAGTIINSKDLASAFGGKGGSEIVYNIGTITIGTEVDGERWLQRLTKNQEIISNGLTPQQRYA
jgi:hypothetical protein